MILPGGYLMRIFLSSKCVNENWNPHKASVIPIVCSMYRSLPIRLNWLCSFSTNTITTSPGSTSGCWVENKGKYCLVDRQHVWTSGICRTWVKQLHVTPYRLLLSISWRDMVVFMQINSNQIQLFPLYHSSNAIPSLKTFSLGMGFWNSYKKYLLLPCGIISAAHQWTYNTIRI